MTALVSRSVSDLLAAFSSSDPTPGGGSASALAGALGARLLIMVASMAKTRNGSVEDRVALDSTRDRLTDAAVELEGLVDRDTDAYDRVVAAYRLPKGTDAERAARSDAIQAALGGAIQSPLAMLRAASGAASDAAIVAQHGNPGAASDVTVASELLHAAANGAFANVAINLASLRDKDRAAALRREAELLRRQAEEGAAAAQAALARPT